VGVKFKFRIVNYIFVWVMTVDEGESYLLRHVQRAVRHNFMTSESGPKGGFEPL